MTHPYEPAAQIAERAADRHLMGTSAWNDFHKIAREIRALPHPPGVTPKFLRDLYYLNILSPVACEQLAKDINEHLRAQPVSTPPKHVLPDNATVEAVARAICGCTGTICTMLDGSDKTGYPKQCAEQARRALAAINDRSIAAERVLPVFTAEDIGRYEHGYAARQSVEGKRRHHIAACINARIAGSGFAQSDLASELVHGADRIDDKSWQYGYDRAIADTQARINEAVLAEREAFLKAVKTEKQKIKYHDSYKDGCLDRLENAIHARTTNTEIVTNGATGHTHPPSGTTSLPGIKDDADLESLNEKLYRQIIDKFPQLRRFNDTPMGWGGGA